ncbi:MAG TPA: hypothetical protein VLS25_01475, partial [Dehalococcoidia bacterium]|nr:hypothetical protein [Dehalococcoidia bacterium]
TKIYLRRGEDRLQFWKDDSIWIGAPTAELETLADSTKDWNHVSYVLFVGYSDYWVVLGGDASERTWESIYAVWGDWMKRADVKILKASHHGRDTGYHQPSVAALEPEYTIISVGRLPDTDASNKYRQYSKVYTTRYHGNIKAQLWYDGDVWLHDAKGRRIN